MIPPSNNRQPFTKMPVHLLGQQQQQPTPEQIQAHLKAQAQAVVEQLALGLYSRLAPDCMPDEDALKKLAQNCRTAARCYFEGIE